MDGLGDVFSGERPCLHGDMCETYVPPRWPCPGARVPRDEGNSGFADTHVVCSYVYACIVVGKWVGLELNMSDTWLVQGSQKYEDKSETRVHSWFIYSGLLFSSFSHTNTASSDLQTIFS